MLIDERTHLIQRLVDTGDLLYKKSIAGNQTSVLAALIAAHSCFIISGFFIILGKLFDNQSSDKCFAYICAGSSDKKIFTH